MYRLNTYPIIHTGFFHAVLNALALTPLLERFEAEHGTLTSIALFVGRECHRRILRIRDQGYVQEYEMWLLIVAFNSAVDFPSRALPLDREGYSAQKYCGSRCKVSADHRRDICGGSNGTCSVWVFLLLGSEAIRTFKTNPHFRYVHGIEALCCSR